MAEVKAITPINHGVGNGQVDVYAVGDTLTADTFGEEGLKRLIADGAAVEIGKGRKYTDEPVVSEATLNDEATLLRDQLIAQSTMSGGDEPAPPVDESKSAKG